MKNNKIVGITFGSFDLCHYGHILMFKECKEHCDYLIVGITTDELAMSVKGEKPFISFEERVEIVESIKFVDEVVPQTTYNKMKAWNNLKFDRMFVGDDWKDTKEWIQIEKNSIWGYIC